MTAVPDKSFLTIPRMERFKDTRYVEGIDAFLAYADKNPGRSRSGRLFCPCEKCKNNKMLDRAVVREHLVRWHFYKEYTHWDRHGEGLQFTARCSPEPPVHPHQTTNDTQEMLEDLMAGTIPMDNNMEDDNENIELPTNLADIEKIMKLLDENEKELYEGCTEFTRLSFVVRLLHFQSISSLSNVHFDMLLDLLRLVIPNGRESIPKSHYEATKLVKALGFDYEKIHACPNDCMLYYKERSDMSSCAKCGVSRWRRKKRSSVTAESNSMVEDKIPAKIFRYFPLTRRLE